MKRSRSRFMPVSMKAFVSILFLLFSNIHIGLASPVNAVPFNNILLLDGVDDYASTPDHASLDLGTIAGQDFTIETFFFVPDLTNTETDTLLHKNGAYKVYILYSNTIQDRFIFSVYFGPLLNDYLYIFYNVDLTPGWHHVAAVYDNEFTADQDLLALYLDGAQVKTGGGFDITPGVYNSTSAVNIGAYIGINPSNGSMEEVRFSSVVRYNGSYTVPTSPFTVDANTRALWHFNEAVGSTTFLDSSGNSNTLTGLSGAKTGQQDISPRTISGNTGVSQVKLNYTDGIPKTAVTLTNGTYSFTVQNNWSGTVTPTHACFSFTPASRSYVNVITNQASQNYTPSFNAGSGCADVNIWIGATNRGRFGLPAGASNRASFTGVDNGPVEIVSNNNVPLIGAERVIYKVNGVNTSFSEMMALPAGQLDNIYWLPWYNNVDLDTQLRIANISATQATVHVTIGGVEMTGSPYILAAGASTRKSYPGIDKGPVKIESNVDIVAAERVIYKVNNTATSFSEMMALPNSRLDTIYWLPWYNNKTLNTQLRIANPSETQQASVDVSIGGTPVPGSPFTLGPGASIRKNFTGLDKGPVKIESNIPVVAAERVIYRVNGVDTSFSEMMAMPESQLDTIYWLPWYNNKTLNTQLRIANPSETQQASVDVSIGGTPVLGSPFTLGPGASLRKSFTGIDKGPVKIESDIPVVAAERVIYNINGVDTSFSEMMALPNGQLYTTYWLPWYNNVDLDTQLRFGVP